MNDAMAAARRIHDSCQGILSTGIVLARVPAAPGAVASLPRA
jgi:hypothetical protein